MTLGKRILSVILTVTIVLSMFPLSAFASAGNEASVKVGNATTEFATYGEAVAFANKNDGSVITLLSDIVSSMSEDPNDLPFVTSDITLDLNGKNIDFVDVGSVVYDEEEDETSKGKSGSLTVTGDGNIELLTVNDGSLTLKSGTVAELAANCFAAEINIDSGTVEDLNLSALGDDKIAATVSGGSVLYLNLGDASATFTGGDHASSTRWWSINGGTLFISGGNFSYLKMLVSGGNIALSGGEYGYISTDPEAPSSEYKKPTLGSLLSGNSAFYGKDGSIVNSDVLTLENVKIISNHDHTYKDGKCTECGASCNHSGTVNFGDGVCSACGLQLEAAVVSPNGNTEYFTSFISAFDSIPHGIKQTVTVYLLKDFYTLTEDLYIANNSNIKLDLNAKVLSGNKKIIVEKGNSLTLANGDIDSGITIEATGGTLTVDETCGDIGKISVTDADSSVSVKGGNIEDLRLAFIDTASLNNIKLSGGKIGYLSFSEKGTVAVTDMLEAGCALKDNRGILASKAGGLVSYGRVFSTNTLIRDLEVVPCDHSEGNDAKGYCNYCGKIYEAKITDKNGDVRYTETLQETDFGDGNTVMLFRDVTEPIIPKSDCTIDPHGHSVGLISFIVDGGTLTLKGYGKIAVLILGYQDTDSTLVIEQQSFANRIEIGTLSVNKTTNTKLTSGQFDKIERKDGGFVEDLLADGYSFFDKKWDGPEYISGKTSTSKTYYIYTHEHWFIVNIDGETQCQECGMPCHHTKIGADGKCEDVCGRQIYTATLTKADGTAVNYESFTDAWTAATENENSTLKLLCDLDIGSSGEWLLETDGGNFTLDLNSRTLDGSAGNSIIRITGTADIKIINGKIGNKFDGDSSSLTPTGANAVRTEGGATLTLTGVEFTAGSNENMRGSAVYVTDGKLTVTDSVFGGLVMLLKRTEDVSVKLASSEFRYGITYGYVGEEKEYESVRGFFADGNMFFDGDGKYIDITDDSLWDMYDTGENKLFNFSFVDNCSVKPHTHTYSDGICSECDYKCPHNGGNDREASYFEKAVCSVCKAEYGDYVQDQTMPTGEVKIQGRSFWQTFWYTISFGMFYKEPVTVEITATDDSYDSSGFDPAKHSVKIEYFVSTEAMDPDDVITGKFYEYTGPFGLSDDNKYVIYVKITDYAGNFFLASSNGHVVDTTPPEIEGCENGETVNACGDLTLTFKDENLDKVTQIVTDSSGNDKELTLTLTDGKYTLAPAYSPYIIKAYDKAGNTTTVTFNVGWNHDFDPETQKCRHCGKNALIEQTVDGKTELYDSFDSAIDALRNAGEYEISELKLLGDVSKSGSLLEWSFGKRIFNLNGHTFSLTPNANGWGGKIYASKDIDMTVTGGGTADTEFYVYNGGTLTVDMGDGRMKKLTQSSGMLEVVSGTVDSLEVFRNNDDPETSRTTELCGGYFGDIKIVGIDGLTCADLLCKGFLFEGLILEQAKVTELHDVTVVPCYHEHIDENYYCSDCGLQFVAAVRIGNVETLFETFERAVRYAEKNDGCTVKLLQDLALDDATVGSLKNWYRIYLEKGRYTLDLAGKTLDIINGSQVVVRENCDLTIGDSVGGGKVISSSGGGDVQVGHYLNNNAKLTVTGGEFTVNVTSYNRSALVLMGGSLKKYVNSSNLAKCSPFVYLSDGYTFALTDPAGGNNYANEGNVEIDHDGSQMIRNVTVVPVPLTIDEQPTDLKFYLTSKEDDKYAEFAVSAIGRWWGDIVNVTFEKEDGTVIEETVVPAYESMHKGLSAVNFTVSDSGSYRIKLELKGYILYSDTFSITVTECDHSGYDGTTHKCTLCECDLAAAVVKDGKTTGYVNFADALAAAQTDENKGCVLWLLTDVTEKIAVSAGDFKLGINGHTVGILNVTKTAKLNIFDGTVNGAVTVAKNAQLTASVINFMGTVSDNSNMSSFINCVFGQTLNARGSNANFNGCTVNGALNVSGTDVTLNASSVSGKITVNNGGVLQFMGNGGKYGEAYVKSGGTMKVYTGNTFTGNVMAETGGTLLLSGGELKNITVNGQHLIDCLAEGKAFEDMNNGFIIDGRVGIAGDVKVVDHTHTCVWKTDTHEKLCGCGYVEQTDSTAPVISGIENGKTYYGPAIFTVSDDNDFTVEIDGKVVTSPVNTFIIDPDNLPHTIKVTDIAGNTVTVGISVYKTYKVTLGSGTGYTVSGGFTAGYGTDYTFTIDIAEGYSKTEDFMVDVNGMPLRSDSNTYTYPSVESDLYISVYGVADITPPSAEIEIGDNIFNSFMNAVTFGLFFKETKTVTVTASDAGSGLAKVEYLLSETAFANKEAVTGDFTELTVTDGKASFDIEPNKKAFVYIRVTDMSGNVSVINSDGIVIYADAEKITESETVVLGEEPSFDVAFNGNSVREVYINNTLVPEYYLDISENKIQISPVYISLEIGAGEYTVRVLFSPLGEEYSDGKGDSPAEVVMKLTVEKMTAEITVSDGQNKIYDGKPTDNISYTASTDGRKLLEYKPFGADDSEYTATAPTAAGKYTVRVSTSETDRYKAAFATAEYEILPREIIISGVTVSDKVYDGNTDADITFDGNIDGLIAGDDLTVIAGNANFSDKNVGKGKTVTFTEFSLTGSSAGNYTLSAQPENATADISAKELTVGNLKVKNKQYDGRNTAEIDGTPVLVGLVGGDSLTLLCGEPSFDSVEIGKNIPVSFTGFAVFGDSTTVGNYKLIQPSGITADISEYLSDGSEYTVNSNDWINSDFTVKAKDGYLLSLTDTADGEWTDALSATDENADGTFTFYIKNTATGVISASVSEKYKIDKTAPTGEVILNGRSLFKTILNKITFGLFFKDDVEVSLTATDALSGIKSVTYFKSDKILTDSEVKAITDWTENRSFGIEAVDMDKFVIYVRIEDNAGNVAFIGSDGAEFDTVPPEIIGVADEETYYVTKRAAVDDENLETVTVNGNEVGEVFTLDGDRNATYIIRATDKAGNVTECTVYMRPISDITDPIKALTEENVKSSDFETVKTVERNILDIAEMFDDEESTEEEWNKILDASAKTKALTLKIYEFVETIDEISEKINGYDVGTVTSADKADIENLISDIENLLGGDNLTAEERENLETLKEKAKALLERINTAKEAVGADNIEKVGEITPDNVKAGDKDDLEKAKEAIEKALDDFGGNFTEEERENLEKKLETVKKALETIENAEKATDEIGKLPSVDDAKLKDKDEVEKVKEIVDGLTENEKEILGKDLIDRINGLYDKIKKLEEISFNPSIIEGAGQSWNESSGENAKFRSNAEFDEFLKVLVDGKELDSENYLVYEGSTAVELKAGYLKTLAAGKHTLDIVSQNGTATTTFTIVRNSEAAGTGDFVDLSLWFALMFISGGMISGIALLRKKEEN